jgi:hypothetical protein
MKYLFLITILTSVLFAGSYIYRDDGNETVNDCERMLMWQDNGDINTTALNWQGAINYCENLELAGYTNWHLPNVNELLSITATHYQTKIELRESAPTVTPVINYNFKNIHESDLHYWSATTSKSTTTNAWAVDFNTSEDIGQSKSSINAVRCVRPMDENICFF